MLTVKVRASAARALGNQSNLSELGIGRLMGLLYDADCSIRKSAERALEQTSLSKNAIAYITALASDKYGWVRESAARVLGKQVHLSETGIQRLIELSFDEYRPAQKLAIKALENQRSLSTAGIERLIVLSSENERWIKESVIAALRHQRSLSDVGIDCLVTLSYDDKNGPIKLLSVQALEKQVSLSEAGIARLIALSFDQDSWVQESAIAVLSAQINLPEVGVARLIELSYNKSEDMRTVAINALITHPNWHYPLILEDPSWMNKVYPYLISANFRQTIPFYMHNNRVYYYSDMIFKSLSLDALNKFKQVMLEVQQAVDISPIYPIQTYSFSSPNNLQATAFFNATSEVEFGRGDYASMHPSHSH